MISAERVTSRSNYIKDSIHHNRLHDLVIVFTILLIQSYHQNNCPRNKLNLRMTQTLYLTSMLPNPLVALQTYLPESSAAASLIRSDPFVDLRNLSQPAWIESPSFVHSNKGSGFASTGHGSLIVSPALTCWRRWIRPTIWGGSGETKFQLSHARKKSLQDNNRTSLLTYCMI